MSRPVSPNDHARSWKVDSSLCKSFFPFPHHLVANILDIIIFRLPLSAHFNTAHSEITSLICCLPQTHTHTFRSSFVFTHDAASFLLDEVTHISERTFCEAEKKTVTGPDCAQPLGCHLGSGMSVLCAVKPVSER